MSKNKPMPEHKRLVTACALPKKKTEKKKKNRMDGKRKGWRDRFNLALANQQSLFYFASYFASVLNPSS